MMRLDRFALGALVLLTAAVPGEAVDGVTEINQTIALSGGVTPGDAAGFPVTIDQAGSYRLTGNLTVPNENTTAVVISVEGVTLDLNGFSIIGAFDPEWTERYWDRNSSWRRRVNCKRHGSRNGLDRSSHRRAFAGGRPSAVLQRNGAHCRLRFPDRWGQCEQESARWDVCGR